MAVQRYYYSDSIRAFLEKNANEVVGHLVQSSIHDVNTETTNSWIEEINTLKIALKPYGKGTVMGIGGEENVDTYSIHVLLPCGFLACDVEAYCSDIAEDILIGMDIINLTDFIITNTDGNTNFTLRAPSEGINI